MTLPSKHELDLFYEGLTLPRTRAFDLGVFVGEELRHFNLHPLSPKYIARLRDLSGDEVEFYAGMASHLRRILQALNAPDGRVLRRMIYEPEPDTHHEHSGTERDHR